MLYTVFWLYSIWNVSLRPTSKYILKFLSFKNSLKCVGSEKMHAPIIFLKTLPGHLLHPVNSTRSNWRKSQQSKSNSAISVPRWPLWSPSSEGVWLQWDRFGWNLLFSTRIIYHSWFQVEFIFWWSNFTPSVRAKVWLGARQEIRGAFTGPMVRHKILKSEIQKKCITEYLTTNLCFRKYM